MTASTFAPVVDPAVEAVFAGHTGYDFDPTPLPEGTLESIYELIKFGPTGLNMQPMRLFAVTGAAKERLIANLAEGNRARTATAPLTVLVAADTNFHDLLPRTFPVAPGMREMFLDDQFRTATAVQQTFLQLGYFIMGARSLGYVVGPMNGMDHAGMDRDLLAGTGCTAVAVVNIGYPGPNAHYPRNPRLAADEAITQLG